MQEFIAFCARCSTKSIVLARTIGGAIRKCTVNCNCKPRG